MAIDASVVGKKFGPFKFDYNMEKLNLFAVGCNCGYDMKAGEEYYNEYLPGGLKVLPIFGAMPLVCGEVTNTVDYGADLRGTLHWGIDLKIKSDMNRLAQKSGTLSTDVTVVGMWDRGPGKGLLCQEHSDTYDDDGTLVCECETWDCLIYDGGWGGEKPPADIVEMPDREPDFEMSETIAMNAGLAFRLTGMLHPLHVDWPTAKAAGFPIPFYFGLGYGGIAMRHMIDTFMPGEPERLTRFKVRMCAPVMPGATVKTQMWKMEDGSVRFRLVDALATTAKPYLNWGIMEYKN